jgi:hypothetical protein
MKMIGALLFLAVTFCLMLIPSLLLMIGPMLIGAEISTLFGIDLFDSHGPGHPVFQGIIGTIWLVTAAWLTSDAISEK